jgi:hypothetical protein
MGAAAQPQRKISSPRICTSNTPAASACNAPPGAIATALPFGVSVIVAPYAAFGVKPAMKWRVAVAGSVYVTFESGAPASCGNSAAMLPTRAPSRFALPRF